MVAHNDHLDGLAQRLSCIGSFSQLRLQYQALCSEPFAVARLSVHCKTVRMLAHEKDYTIDLTDRLPSGVLPSSGTPGDSQPERLAQQPWVRA